MQHSSYVESKVLTAPPQRLHLMLIEGAIRFGRQAEESLRLGNHAASANPMLRVIDILGELLAGVREKKGASTRRSQTCIGTCFVGFLRRRLMLMRRHSEKFCSCWSTNGRPGTSCVTN